MNTFPVGAVLNPLKSTPRRAAPVFSEIELKYPARLNAMALDPSQIAVSQQGVYTPGEIVFPIDIYKDVHVSVQPGGEITCSTESPRPQLIRHAALIMRNALGVADGLKIDVRSMDLRHCGLGSSSGLIAAVATAINELYGKPISATDLIPYLAQNHGEEIDDSTDHLQHVQCIGGSAASGLAPGGMTILAGESVPIASMIIDSNYTVVIGIPKHFAAPDARTMMDLEFAHIDKFVETGLKYKDRIGYRVVHETIPAMLKGDLRKASKLIFDYRFDYGSIENCAFAYPKIIDIANNIKSLYVDEIVDTLALSSVGPAFFAITKSPEQCAKIFEANELSVFNARIVNHGYRITNLVEI